MNIGTNGHDKHLNVTKLEQIKARGHLIYAKDT